MQTKVLEQEPLRYTLRTVARNILDSDEENGSGSDDSIDDTVIGLVKRGEEVLQKHEENNSVIVRVVVPAAFIMPDITNADQLSKEDLIARIEEYTTITDTSLSKEELLNVYGQHLKPSFAAQANIGLKVILSDDTDSEIDTATKPDPKERRQEATCCGMWKYNVRPEAPTMHFGLTYFPSSFRFAFTVARDFSENLKLQFVFFYLEKSGKAEWETKSAIARAVHPIGQELKEFVEGNDSVKSVKLTGKSRRLPLSTQSEYLEKKQPEKSNAWAEVFIDYMTQEAARLRPTDNNEYPVLPADGIDEVEIKDMSIFESMFKAFQLPEFKIKVETFALRYCHHRVFENALDICIKNSDDALRTALNASRICEERAKTQRTMGENWASKKKHAITIAASMGEIIADMRRKPVLERRYYIDVGNYFLDTNLDYGVEMGIEELCLHPVFFGRTETRWKEKRLRLFPLTRRVSPELSYWLQFLFFVLFLLLLTYTTSSSNKIYQILWHNSLDDLFFGTGDGIMTNEDGTGLFDNITDITTFYTWVEHQLIPNIFFWDGRFSNETRYHYLSSPQVSIRQFRVGPDNTCGLSTGEDLEISCYPSIESGLLPKTSTWKGSPWESQVGIEGLKGVATVRYPSGGYTVYLSSDTNRSSSVISSLRNAEWIDVGTRAVIIEFTIYSPNAQLFAIVATLIEQTHVGTFHKESSIKVFDPSRLDPMLEWYLILLAITLVGYIGQETAEIVVLFKTTYAALLFEKRESRQKRGADSNLLTIQKVSNFQPILLKALKDTWNNHFKEIWNIFDFCINLCIFLYIVIGNWTRVLGDFNPYNSPVQSIYSATLLAEIAQIFAAIGVIFAWIRVLYFFLSIKRVGPLILSMLYMGYDILYFFILLSVIVIGFAAAFDAIYGGIDPNFTGVDISVFSSITIAWGQFFDYRVPNNHMLPLPIKYFGDFLLLFYVLVAVILLINLLIAMMSHTFDEIMDEENINKKWALFRGDLLLHFERFIFLPPPLNIPHFMLWGVWRLCCNHIDPTWRLYEVWQAGLSYVNKEISSQLRIKLAQPRIRSDKYRRRKVKNKIKITVAREFETRKYEVMRLILQKYKCLTFITQGLARGIDKETLKKELKEALKEYGEERKRRAEAKKLNEAAKKVAPKDKLEKELSFSSDEELSSTHSEQEIRHNSHQSSPLLEDKLLADINADDLPSSEEVIHEDSSNSQAQKKILPSSKNGPSLEVKFSSGEDDEEHSKPSVPPQPIHKKQEQKPEDSLLADINTDDLPPDEDVDFDSILISSGKPSKLITTTTTTTTTTSKTSSNTPTTKNTTTTLIASQSTDDIAQQTEKQKIEKEKHSALTTAHRPKRSNNNDKDPKTNKNQPKTKTTEKKQKKKKQQDEDSSEFSEVEVPTFIAFDEEEIAKSFGD